MKWIFSTFILLLAGLSANAGDPYAEGPATVHNPAQPSEPGQTFSLVEELSIGGGEEEHCYFHRARSVGVDHRGRIYVLDGGFCRVEVYDKEGQYLHSIGSKGAGPGEMKPGTGLAVDGPGNKVWVLDPLNKRLSSWTLDGDFLDTIPFAKPLSEQLLSAPDGSLLVNYFYYKQDQPHVLMTRYPSGKDAGVDLMDIPRFGERSVRRENGAPMKVTPFHPRHYFAVNQDGLLIHGFSDDHLLKMIDENGKIIRRIQWTATRLEVDREAREAFLARIRKKAQRRGITIDTGAYRFPEWDQVFHGIWVDGRNRIWVRVNAPVEGLSFDVFDPSGVYLHRVALPSSRDNVHTATIFDNPAFQGDFLYSIVRDAEGEILAKRYRIEERPTH